MKRLRQDRIREKACRVIDGATDVILAYLFGSQATGRAGPLSDVDIAVYTREGMDPEAFGRLQDAMCRELGTDKVDLIELRTASFPFAYRVLRDGELLMSRDEKLRQHFEATTVMRYLDFKPFEERTAREYMRAVASAEL